MFGLFILLFLLVLLLMIYVNRPKFQEKFYPSAQREIGETVSECQARCAAQIVGSDCNNRDRDSAQCVNYYNCMSNCRVPGCAPVCTSCS